MRASHALSHTHVAVELTEVMPAVHYYHREGRPKLEGQQSFASMLQGPACNMYYTAQPRTAAEKLIGRQQWQLQLAEELCSHWHTFQQVTSVKLTV
jgi:hypothetical protein